MSDVCTTDCSVGVCLDYVALDLSKLDCAPPGYTDDPTHVLGCYPLAGDFDKDGYDVVYLTDLNVFQLMTVPENAIWRICSDLIIEPGGELVVDGTIIIG